MSGYQQQQPSGDSYGTDQAGYGGDQQDLSGAGGNQEGSGGDQGRYAASDPSTLAQGQGREKKDRRREHEAGVGGLAAGGHALHERHKAEKVPEHTRRQQLLEEESALAIAVGAGGYAFQHHKEIDDEPTVDEPTVVADQG